MSASLLFRGTLRLAVAAYRIMQPVAAAAAIWGMRVVIMFFPRCVVVWYVCTMCLCWDIFLNTAYYDARYKLYRKLRNRIRTQNCLSTSTFSKI